MTSLSFRWFCLFIFAFSCTFCTASSVTPTPISTPTPQFNPSKTQKVEKRRKKRGGFWERARHRMEKLLKAHDTFLVMLFICLFLLALAFFLGIILTLEASILAALQIITIVLLVITVFVCILWLRTVNMRKHL